MITHTESFLRGVSNRASLDLDSTRHYAAIIGAAPSKGARSPSLSNRAFKALNISAVMHPHGRRTGRSSRGHRGIAV
jgi:hypothetical protein